MLLSQHAGGLSVSFGAAVVQHCHTVCEDALCGTSVKVDKQLLQDVGSENKGIVLPYRPLSGGVSPVTPRNLELEIFPSLCIDLIGTERGR